MKYFSTKQNLSLRNKSNTHSGNSPSTRQMYCFCTCRFLIWCSICLAFFGLLPNNSNPDVNRSNRWIVRKFFKLYSLARINTTVLWRYLPHGWTWKNKLRLTFSSFPLPWGIKLKSFSSQYNIYFNEQKKLSKSFHDRSKKK